MARVGCENVLGFHVFLPRGRRFFPSAAYEISQFEVANTPNAKFLPVPSIWGHFAGGPGTNPDDVKFLDKALKELLAS